MYTTIEEEIETSFNIMIENIKQIEANGDGGVDPMSILQVAQTIKLTEKLQKYKAQGQILKAWLDNRIKPVNIG